MLSVSEAYLMDALICQIVRRIARLRREEYRQLTLRKV